MSVETVRELKIKRTLPLKPREDFDVVIAGAGISGLYAAWRIAQDWCQSRRLSEWAAARPDKRLRIALVEWSDCIGGRIDSRIIAGMQHVPAELGGMRFTEDHKLLCLVVKRFNLPTERFPMSSNRQYYLRGRRFDEKAIRRGYRVPYALASSERKMTPNQLTNLAIKRICKYADEWTDANWQWIKQNFRYTDRDKKVYRDVPLYDIGFWNILYRVISNEGYDYVRDGGGYNSNTINWNAAEAMPYMLTDFSKPTEFFRITTGFHSLPIALSDDLERLRVPIMSWTRLTSFEKQGDHLKGCTESVRGKATATFRTRALILAMPQRSLQLLDQRCEFFRNEQVQYTIQSVLPQPAYKLFLAYRQRWWSSSKFCPGPTITDLPLRMTYDFGSEEERGGKPGDTRSLMLAAYCDMEAESFWNVLEREKIFVRPPLWSRTALRGGGTAPATMRRMAEDQLVKSLRVRGARRPTPTRVIDAYYHDWSFDPYGAGYHAWAAHFKAWEVMEEVRHPMRGWPVYICGEAYSNAQGWAEGALCTAESVLEEFFGLPRIQDLPDEYPLLAPNPVKPGTPEAYPTYLTVRTPQLVF